MNFLRIPTNIEQHNRETKIRKAINVTRICIDLIAVLVLSIFASFAFFETNESTFVCVFCLVALSLISLFFGYILGLEKRKKL